MFIFFELVLLYERCFNIIYNILNVKEDILIFMGKWKIELFLYGVDDILV